MHFARLGPSLALALACTPGAGDTSATESTTTGPETTTSASSTTSTTTAATQVSTTTTTTNATTQDPTTGSTTVSDPECDQDLICDELEGEDLVGCLHDCGGCTPTGTCVENKETPYSCPEDCAATGCNQDGKIDALTEQCDDGNDVDEDGCTNACALNVCGDGVLYPVEAGGSEECDDGNAEAGDGCSAGCLLEGRTVFVTSAEYKGNLGGLAGADAECMARAKDKLTGQYKAWLSDGMEGPSTRFMVNPAFTGPYELVNGTVVAMGWADLTDGSLLHPINVDELGTEMIDSTVWTNTTAGGNPTGGENCASWSMTSGPGRIGLAQNADEEWTDAKMFNPQQCSSSARLYCFQVN